MRRYFPLLLISFFVTIIVIAGTSLLAGYAGKQRPENLKTFTVYTTLPIEQVSILANEYERQNKIRINIVPMSPSELLARTLAEKNAPKSDLVLSDASVLREAKKLGLLTPYASEQTDIIPMRFKDKDSSWTGLWYDIFIFAVNKDAIKTLPAASLKWDDLSTGKIRLAMTDFLAADAAAHLLFTLVSTLGEDQTIQYLNKLHPQMVQYAKFLATPARMSGMGEADIAIAVQSETLRYVNDAFPIKVFYPQDGTAYLLTAAALTGTPLSTPEAKQFIDWLLQNNAQQLLTENKYFFIPVNPEIPSAKAFAQNNIKLLDVSETMTADARRKILDRWVQTVRLAPRQ